MSDYGEPWSALDCGMFTRLMDSGRCEFGRVTSGGRDNSANEMVDRIVSCVNACAGIRNVATIRSIVAMCELGTLNGEFGFTQDQWKMLSERLDLLYSKPEVKP